ncbi:hypothetical protein SynROS8604_01946 [Synechococcus sp. ROS8604]|nr:hypothetical protein SynROS8604_01946 [Synechococcus sp. ROS8604]
MRINIVPRYYKLDIQDCHHLNGILHSQETSGINGGAPILKGA